VVLYDVVSLAIFLFLSSVLRWGVSGFIRWGANSFFLRDNVACGNKSFAPGGLVICDENGPAAALVMFLGFNDHSTRNAETVSKLPALFTVH